MSLENLPEKLKIIDLGNNTLSGAISLTKLPQALEFLELNNRRIKHLALWLPQAE